MQQKAPCSKPCAGNAPSGGVPSRSILGTCQRGTHLTPPAAPGRTATRPLPGARACAPWCSPAKSKQSCHVDRVLAGGFRRMPALPKRTILPGAVLVGLGLLWSMCRICFALQSLASCLYFISSYESTGQLASVPALELLILGPRRAAEPKQ